MGSFSKTERETVTLDRDEQVVLPFTKIHSNSINIMGLKRTGKSNSAAVFLESWLDAGYPLTIVDPHNEGWGFKFTAALEPSPYHILVAGRGKRADIPLNVEHAADLAEFSYTNRITVVLSLLHIHEEERFAILKAYFERLWTLAERAYDEEDVQSYGIALEEAPTYLPQVGTTLVKPIFKKVVQEGGKFGLTTFLITQRSQDIDKAVLGQGAIYLLHRVIHPRDKEVYRGIVPEPAERVEKRITSLQTGDAILVDEGVVQVIHVKPQKTFHVGVTPGAKQRQAPDFSLLDATMLEQLRAMMTAEPKPDPLTQEMRRLERKVEELETAQQEREQEYQELLNAKEKEIHDLQTQLAIVQRIDLALDGSALVRGEPMQSVLHLDSLSTTVERATIDVATLGMQQGGSDADMPFASFVAHFQRIEQENVRLQGEVERLQTLLQEQGGQETLIGERRQSTTIHFGQATIGTLNAGSAAPIATSEWQGRGQPSVSITEMTATPTRLLTGNALLESLLRSERSSFRRLTTQISALSTSEKILLTWLLEHDGEEFYSVQLADAVNLDSGAAYSRRTEHLAKLPFIQRWMDRKLWYQSNFVTYSKATFSSGAVDALVQELLRIASPL